MRVFAIYRVGRYMPIGTVEAPTTEDALVLAETMYGDAVLVGSGDALPWMTPEERRADQADHETVVTALLQRGAR